MADASLNFSQTYDEARGRFLATAASLGIVPQRHIHPAARGHDGETLSIDVAVIGDAKAAKLLILSSGTHGVEGYCGSGAQLALLRDPAFLSRARESGMTLVFVHAVNPYGFSHWSRTNEDNIDLNRNFVDHAKPYPAHAAYAEVHALLVPRSWPPDAATEAAIAEFISARGMRAFQQAVSGGQYAYADGLFFGGNAPSWSNRTVRELLRGFAPTAREVFWIDFHTGLGPYGHGELIHAARDDATELARAKTVWGDKLTSVYDGSSTSARLDGLLAYAAYEELPQARYSGIAIEYGTLPQPQVILALRAENWLRLHPEAGASLRATIRKQCRDAFYCDADDWKAMIVDQARKCAEDALAAPL